jgi:hypothetical protein
LGKYLHERTAAKRVSHLAARGSVGALGLVVWTEDIIGGDLEHPVDGELPPEAAARRHVACEARRAAVHVVTAAHSLQGAQPPRSGKGGCMGVYGGVMDKRHGDSNA